MPRPKEVGAIFNRGRFVTHGESVCSSPINESLVRPGSIPGSVAKLRGRIVG